MLCQNCQERDATFHEVVIRQGKAVETHLCEQCVRRAAAEAAGEESGEPVPGGEAKPDALSGAPKASVQKIMTGMTLGKLAPQPTGPKEDGCPECGLTYKRFKEKELLGCPGCYESFERQLGPLIERTHEGGMHHVGKSPKRAIESSDEDAGEKLLGGMRERSARIATVRRQLEEALNAEKYERAAILRDEIHKLTGGG